MHHNYAERMKDFYFFNIDKMEYCSSGCVIAQNKKGTDGW